jgi:hypothetical protein
MRNPANLIGHMNSQVEHKERRDHVRGGDCGDKEVPETAENDEKFPGKDARMSLLDKTKMDCYRYHKIFDKFTDFNTSEE